MLSDSIALAPSSGCAPSSAKTASTPLRQPHEFETDNADIQQDFSAVGQAVGAPFLRLNADGPPGARGGTTQSIAPGVDQEFAFPAPVGGERDYSLPPFGTWRP